MLDDTVLDESVALAEGRSARIGPYKLLEKIGEGGFGVVFLAEQEAPVVRRVALKIIKLGMDTREVVARFEQERQALAMMEHPNIAKVFDAGATGTGRPYFVMELVRGDPITRYCDTSRSSMRDRLALFVHVCHAVQHAHQKGIIHRDLKPSNVLVTLQDGAPVPKVIDFGIAKATSARLTEKTLFTEHGQFIGTPEYMSPEQAERSGVDIDTRSDIYSLGVLLYELLTGTTPFDREKLRSASFAELQRIIREVDPPRPSTRLSTGKDVLEKVAVQRHTEPRRLCASVRGDLDWIVMKCLEKDRTRRYEAANGLAQDIQRHLDGEPVVAAPPSASYRMRKFIQRHRAGVIAGAAMAALIVFGTVGTTAGMIRALREKTRADESAAQARAAAEAEIQARALAEENEKRAREQSEIAARETARARVAEEEAKARAGELEQVARFQAETLAQVDPTQAGILLTEDVHERLEAALAKAGVPATERTVRVESFRAHWRDINATDTARHLIDRTILSPAAEAIDRQFTDQPLVRARLEQALADRYRELGLCEAAMPLQASALEIRRRILGADHPDTLGSVNNMGLLLQAGEKLVEAEACYREALDGLRRVRGEDHPDTLAAMNNVGFLLRHEGRLDEAEPVFRDTLARLRRVLGNEDPGTLTSVCNMGYVLQEQGRPDEAAPLFREALDGRRRVLGEKHPDTLTSITNMGGLYMSQRKFAEAEPYIREALEKHRSVLGEEHPHTIASLENLGGLLWEQGKLAEAEQCFLEALEKRRSLFGDSHPDTLATMNVVASLLETRGKMDEALTYRRAMLASLRCQPGMSGARLASALAKFGDSLLTHAAHHEASAVEAEVVLRECTEIRRAIYPDGNEAQWLKYNALSLLGKALALQRRFAEAEPLLIAAYERMKDDPRVPSAAVAGTDRRRDALVRIVELYEAWDAAEPATRAQRAGKAAEWRERLSAFDAPAAKN